MKPSHRLSSLGWLMIALLALVIGGCSGREPTSSPTVQPATEIAPQALPAVQAFALVEPEQGGAVRLRDGAEVSLLPGALSARATVTLRMLDAPSAAPVPRSLLGRAYQFSLEGGELTGVALLRIPLPPGVEPDQYDVAAYLWNNETWERINGRLADSTIQFGVGAPGLFVLQGSWRFADATLALIRPEAPASQPLVPLAVAGQYRFSALPKLSGEHVLARLTLKQDISGGAGRVTGNPNLDSTIGEATLWFKPDPAQPQGLIDFSHVFEVPPGKLDVPPGGATRLYALLVVEDAIAPTRRLSSGVEYTQVLGIQAVGMEVVRPTLAAEGRYALRWHIRLNGQTFLLLDATDTRLSLDDVLAKGGLGDYRFTLEAETGGVWAAVSNEVVVQLALKPTDTPPASQEPTPALVAIVSPTPAEATPTSGGVMPATPTRRPTPSTGGPAPSATPTPAAGQITPTPTATLTRPAWASVFWADRYILSPSECTNLYWQVENVLSVFLDGQPVTGNETRQVCPPQTTSYTLRIVSPAGTQEISLPITVSTQGQSTIEFTADSYRVAPRQCTVLRWRVTGVRSVRLNNQGVAGEATEQVCPATTTDYTLRVESETGAITARTITIVVASGPVVDMRFWADQYTLPPNTCTTLHWDVRNVREVFLDDGGVGGSGTRQVCPSVGARYYALRAVTHDGLEAYQYVSLISGNPILASGEIIAQGIVNEVLRQDDLDPVTPGLQTGYRIVLDGINVLFSGSAGWSQAAVTLRLLEEFLSIGAGAADLVSWPVNPGQLVEFRAACEGMTCTLELTKNSYLYLRSP